MHYCIMILTSIIIEIDINVENVKKIIATYISNEDRQKKKFY